MTSNCGLCAHKTLEEYQTLPSFGLFDLARRHSHTSGPERASAEKVPKEVIYSKVSQKYMAEVCRSFLGLADCTQHPFSCMASRHLTCALHAKKAENVSWHHCERGTATGKDKLLHVKSGMEAIRSPNNRVEFLSRSPAYETFMSRFSCAEPTFDEPQFLHCHCRR